MSNWECVDCGAHCGDICEYYMVKDSLWSLYGAGKGMLCIGCLEARVGRELAPRDFTRCPLNYGERYIHSPRLLTRLGLL